MKYTIKNERDEQDNINFIDIINAEKELPSFLNYKDVLKHSLNSDNITSEKNIKSLCDGGDHLEPYFSENSAAYECNIYLEYTPFIVIENGQEVEKTLKFDKAVNVYELF